MCLLSEDGPHAPVEQSVDEQVHATHVQERDLYDTTMPRLVCCDSGGAGTGRPMCVIGTAGVVSCAIDAVVRGVCSRGPVFLLQCVFFFSSRRRHTRLVSDWSSDVCSSDLSHCREPDPGGRRQPSRLAVRPLGRAVSLVE